MTKEEIKQICQIYDNLRVERDAATIAYNSDDAFWEHVLVTYKLSQPSLPSNLDEAALKAYPKMSRLSEPHRVISADNKTHYLGDANEENRVAFKAGAKWMAEQGEIQEHFVIGHTEASHGIPVIVTFPDPKTFEIGDNVIVQIRKKEE